MVTKIALVDSSPFVLLGCRALAAILTPLLTWRYLPKAG